MGGTGWCRLKNVHYLINYSRGSIRDVLEMLPGDSFMKTDKNILDKNKKRKADSKKVIFVSQHMYYVKSLFSLNSRL